MKNIIKYSSPFCLSAVLLLGACKKDYLQTSPSNQVTNKVIFTNTAGAQTALDGLYRLTYTFGVGNYSGHDLFGQKSYDIISDLMGNDMVVNAKGYNWYNSDYQYTAGVSTTDGNRSYTTWLYYYQLINNANGIIVNIDNAVGTKDDKDKIKGQALFMRAYSYFYLVNFWQQTYKGNETKPGVPLYTTSTSNGAPRGTVQNNYDQIIKDLTDAENLLTSKARRDISSVDATTVQALRARVAMQMEDYSTAATYAEKVIPKYSLMTNAQYQSGFSSMNNPEWIWGVNVITDQATTYASFYSQIDASTGGYAALGQQKKITKALYDQINTGDIRKTVFRTPGTGTSTYPDYNQTKFHVPTPGSWAADYMYISVAEMYLIDAEALARTSNEASAHTVLEKLIKNRYPAYNSGSFSGISLINEILLQRRIELWGQGLSLLDIKRLKTGLNRPTGPGNHGTPNFDPNIYTLPDQSSKFLMHIPDEEMNSNKALTPLDQNP